MSSRELERVEVMGRVASGGLKLVHAAEMLELSYRPDQEAVAQVSEKGREGLKHGHAGQASNRGKPKKLRRRVLQLIQKKYSGTEAERFGPTLGNVLSAIKTVPDAGGRTPGRGRWDKMGTFLMS